MQNPQLACQLRTSGETTQISAIHTPDHSPLLNCHRFRAPLSKESICYPQFTHNSNGQRTWCWLEAVEAAYSPSHRVVSSSAEDAKRF